MENDGNWAGCFGKLAGLALSLTFLIVVVVLCIKLVLWLV
jgi:hypothetical protein